MLKQRVPETNEGIQDHSTVEVFDKFARNMRDKGWESSDAIVQSGITGGAALEIGPGPGYIGLEWLKKTSDGTLTGLEISREMIGVAQRNAKEYGLSQRTRYVEGNCMRMEFADASFDAVFSSGSLHEWEDPVQALREMYRVLKPGGRFCITDMRRDVSGALKWMIYCTTKPKEMRPGYLTSLAASYTVEELQLIVKQAGIKDYSVQKELFGLRLSGAKGE